MEKFIFQNLSPEVRKEAIKKSSRGTEILDYDKQLTEAEVENEAQKLAKLNKDFFDVEEEKKASAKEFADQLTEIKNKMKDVSEIIDRRRRKMTGTCHKIINYDTGEVGFYDDLGELVKVHKAFMDELQRDLFEHENEEAVNALEDQSHMLEEKVGEYVETEEIKNHDDSDDSDETDDDDDRPYPYNMD